jgi:hypothetical protein
MADLPLIQGHKPDSIQELWISQALDHYKVKYIYQYEVSGGLRLRGGLIIDFVLTVRNIPLEYYGDYWHESEMSGEDLLRLKAIESYFNMKPLILWEHEADTRQEVFNWIERNVQ